MDRCDLDRDTPSPLPVNPWRKMSPLGYRVRGLNFRKGLAPKLFCFRWLAPKLLVRPTPRLRIMLERAGEFAAIVLTFGRGGESVAIFFLAGEAVIRDGMGE